MDDGGARKRLDKGFRRAAIEIADLFKVITVRAIRYPKDEEAQQRARLALGFYNDVAPFPQLVINEISAKRLPFGYSTKKFAPLFPRYLPTEIYQAIIAHVLEFKYFVRLRTLISLSASSKRLRYLAEPHLYRRPRGAHSIERQWRFMFSLYLEPQRGHLVQSLEFGWFPRPDNTKLLVDIVHACPNVRDLQIQRGSGLWDVGLTTREDVNVLATIFAASPRVTHFWYSTFTEWLPEADRYGDQQQEIYEICAVDDRFAKFAAQLQELALHGQVNWLVRALLHHTSPTLKSLTVGQDIDLDFRPQLLSSLSLRSPHLETLEIRCIISIGEDLIRACNKWTKSLRALRVYNIEFFNGCIGDIIRIMEVLESLHLGYACVLSLGDLEAIAQSPPQRFKSISVHDMNTPGPTDHASVDRIERAIASLMLSHSSTLENLHFIPHMFKLGKRMILGCKQMANLEELYVDFSSDVTAADVDSLLESCPKLGSVPRQFQELSSQPEKWKERDAAYQREFDTEFEMLPPSLG